MQNIRGGMFESITTCRFPWVELNIDLNYYPRLLKAATGVDYTWDKIYEIANRIYTLIRSFWIREYIVNGYKWSIEIDMPPARWFKEPMKKGPFAGAKLDVNRFIDMLRYYYKLRGWDENGVPKRETLRRLGLEFVEKDLEKIGVRLS
jgi:aldehyde:ferredoxin oxidoreductase